MMGGKKALDPWSSEVSQILARRLAWKLSPLRIWIHWSFLLSLATNIAAFIYFSLPPDWRAGSGDCSSTVTAEYAYTIPDAGAAVGRTATAKSVTTCEAGTLQPAVVVGGLVLTGMLLIPELVTVLGSIKLELNPLSGQASASVGPPPAPRLSGTKRGARDTADLFDRSDY